MRGFVGFPPFRGLWSRWMRPLLHDRAMVQIGSPLVGAGSTWLTEGLDAACRMLQEEADQARVLTQQAGALAGMVAWQSPSAEAYRVAVTELARESDAATRLLDDVSVRAEALRDQAVARAAARSGASGGGW